MKNPICRPDGPVFHPDTHTLTKREHFAALAMQGFLACEGLKYISPRELSFHSVKMADALIEELNK